MSETMIPNYRYSVEVRDDKVNQSAGIGARRKLTFEASSEQSRSASPELFRYENKRYSGYKPSCNSDLELPVTLISNDLFKKMENPVITTMNREIVSASSSAPQITGKTIIDIEIDTCV
jgi:hypothetical protein